MMSWGKPGRCWLVVRTHCIEKGCRTNVCGERDKHKSNILRICFFKDILEKEREVGGLHHQTYKHRTTGTYLRGRAINDIQKNKNNNQETE